MATRSEIVSGPSKFDLMLALFDNLEQRRPITFTLETKVEGMDTDVTPPIHIYVVGLGGRGNESWIIKGNCHFSSGHRHVQAIYSTRTRKGGIELTTPELES